MLLRRTGRILRTIDQIGFAHFDAKAPNWIVRDDGTLGPTPIMIDIDGIRQRRWTALGIRRLLKSMHLNKTYGIADSLSLCLGYAPTANLAREELEPDDTPQAPDDPDHNDRRTVEVEADKKN